MIPKSMRPLLPYLKRYRWGFFVGAICTVISNGAWALLPRVIGNAAQGLQSNVTRHKLFIFSLEVLALAAVRGIFLFLTRWVVIGISRDIEFDLRNDLFARLETLSYSYYQRMRTGDIMARMTNDLNAVRMLMGPAIMYSANTLIFTAAALWFMVRNSPVLTLYAVIPLPVVSITIHYFGRQIRDRFDKIQAMFSDISARAQENFSGVRVIRAYVQEEAEIAAFETANLEYVARSLKLVRLMGMLWPTLELMLGVALVLVLWIGGREVLAGRMQIGAFTAFNIYMMQLTFPIIALGWVVNIFQRGTASVLRLNEILQEQPEIHDEPGAEHRSVQGEIEFRELNFEYDGKRVLRDVNLRIPAGSSMAIVGPTGSGKSTLVSLIPRIYDAAPGMVLVDGKPIRQFAMETLRKNIGFVPQETFLFSDRIRENIALGVESASDEEIRRAAGAANIATDIEGFPDSYETMVGERGITLSGGQKQRAAIARALIRNPRILILDDALSSVDTHTEDKILNHLREVMQGRTTIFISHRVSTVRNADRIAVLHGGRIVELGSHDELLALNGYYSDLYNKQLLEEELAEV
jgi:ATP-binding cassette, subfamily B, multidrug efflux pump